MYSTIISASELQRLISTHATPLAIFDTRHQLTNPDAGARLYREGHVPSALFANLDTDLSAQIAMRADGHSGRHPLPDVQTWLKRLGDWGVMPETQVVAYDEAGGVMASRLWWMLRAVGHRAVAVLDGGLAAWLAADGALEAGTGARPASAPPYPGHPRYEHETTMEEVRADTAAGEQQKYLLVDARAPERYRGEVEPYGPVAGHIPGAINAYHAGNLNSDGTFRPPAELQARFAHVLERAQGKQVVMYCGSGVSACHNLLAMEIAGLPSARLFPNSWSGWSATPGLAVAKGDAA